MQTEIVKMTAENAEEVAARAKVIWQKGGLVAFPTETVYGLGGNGLDAAAAQKIYAAKGRPSDNPLILHIADRSQLLSLTTQIDSRAQALMDAFWPGPLTMIFPKAEAVPYETTGGLDTVAVRMPSHPLAMELLRIAGIPVAAPSANRSGRPSPTSAAHVIEDMDQAIDMIIDGGDVGIGVESTIIDLTGEKPVLLRPGFITPEMMEAVLGPIETDAAVYRKMEKGEQPKAPGMKYRHYAPKASMTLISGEFETVISYINEKTESMHQSGKRVGVLATEESKARYHADEILSVGPAASLESVAHNLFRVLREFDEKNVDVIYSETFPESGYGYAVMNRLLKAAGHQVIHL